MTHGHGFLPIDPDDVTWELAKLDRRAADHPQPECTFSLDSAAL